MTHVWSSVFWLGVVWIGYVYAGYPALLWCAGLLKSRAVPCVDSDSPKVSVLLSARNEQKDIGWKIAETLSWDYPPEKLEVLVASDASQDNTDEILKGVSDPRFRFIRLEPRRGKNEALNQLNEIASGDLLFFSDANSHIEPSCVGRMVRHFADPKVGCVTGIERTIREGEDSAVTTGTRASLGYEALVNGLESRLGSVLVCDGSIFCIRRSLFQKLQPDLANDLELPLYIGAAGKKILFDPSIVSLERSTSSPREEFNRKRRICGQGILGMWRLRNCLRGFRAWQFFSRKLLRWFGAVPLLMILVSSVLLASNPFFRMVLALQVIFYGLALTGWLSAARQRQGESLTAFPFFLVLVHVAALVGVVEAAFGRRFSVWDSAVQSRGPGAAAASSPTGLGGTQATVAASDAETMATIRETYAELHSGKR
jgi:cellulose synthase/poly-beta-1,6-N-acetylglucosamine synthase-like glycosyltransferase